MASASSEITRLNRLSDVVNTNAKPNVESPESYVVLRDFRIDKDALGTLDQQTSSS
jgi:hypothetical protein